MNVSIFTPTMIGKIATTRIGRMRSNKLLVNGRVLFNEWVDIYDVTAAVFPGAGGGGGGGDAVRDAAGGAAAGVAADRLRGVHGVLVRARQPDHLPHHLQAPQGMGPTLQALHTEQVRQLLPNSHQTPCKFCILLIYTCTHSPCMCSFLPCSSFRSSSCVFFPTT